MSPYLVFFSLYFIVGKAMSKALVLGDVNFFEAANPFHSPVNVTVFNAFGNQNVFARISFGKGSRGIIDQIGYGRYKTSPLYLRGEDYIIQFMQLPTGATVEGFTAYGHLGHLEPNVKEILIIIIPSMQDRPEARVITFHNHSDGFNRLYFFNGMINKKHPDKGVFIYGSYDRPNYDGSRSRSINQYANDLPFGEGRESTLFPGTKLTIKAFHESIRSVPEFDMGPTPLCSSVQVIGVGNIQSYIILFGGFNNGTEPPALKALNINVLKSRSLPSFVSNSILFITLLLSICL